MIHFLHFAKRNLRTRKLEAKLLRVLAADVGKLQRRVLLGFSSPELKDSEQRRMQNRYCTPEACLPHQSPPLRQRTPNLSSTKQN